MTKVDLRFLTRNGIAVSDKPIQRDSYSISLGERTAEVFADSKKVVYTNSAIDGIIGTQKTSTLRCGAINYPRANPHIALGNFVDIETINAKIDDIISNGVNK